MIASVGENIVSGYKLRTPIVFLIYKRPDTTARVFREIAKAKPPKLLVVADGPKPNLPDEVQKCAETRAIIEQVDWDCEILTNYADTNLGLKNRVPSGLKWAFEHIEQAIILEDDCLPDQTFFRFAEELLWRYKDDTRILSISGNNFQGGRNTTKYSYYFSRYFHCWGWATWRRSMELFDPDIPLWPEIRDNNWLESIFDSKREVRFWEKIFERVFNGEIDTWAYQWVLMLLAQNGLSIVPSVNLVSNIGFSENATHTISDDFRLANIPTMPMTFLLRHPAFVIRHKQADAYTSQRVFGIRSFYRRLISKMSRMLDKRP